MGPHISKVFSICLTINSKLDKSIRASVSAQIIDWINKEKKVISYLLASQLLNTKSSLSSKSIIEVKGKGEYLHLMGTISITVKATEGVILVTLRRKVLSSEH